MRYVPGKRYLKNGLILPRDEYFHLCGYEFSFKAGAAEKVTSHIWDNFVKENPPNLIGKVLDRKDRIVFKCGVRGRYAQLEFYRYKTEGDYSLYRVLLTDFYATREVYGGDEVNIALTIIEKSILEMDPACWARQCPAPRKLLNGIGSIPERWEMTTMDGDISSVEAAKKGLKEGYLAELMRDMGYDVVGGAEYYTEPNPLTEERKQHDLDLIEGRAISAAEKKKQEEAAQPKKEAKKCPKCGLICTPMLYVCPKCGEPIHWTHEEKVDAQVTVRQYDLFSVLETGEFYAPYLSPSLDENAKPVPDYLDGEFREYTINGVTIQKKFQADSGFSNVMQDLATSDYKLYVSDARIVLVNKKYNKDKGVGWIGLGSPLAGMIAGGLTWAGRGIRAAARRGKALAGHLRYEWIKGILAANKKGILGDDRLLITYRDPNKTEWRLFLSMNPKNTKAEDLANILLTALAKHRDRMTNEKNEEMQAFINDVISGKKHIIAGAGTSFEGYGIPQRYFASKGQPYLPDPSPEQLAAMRMAAQAAFGQEEAEASDAPAEAGEQSHAAAPENVQVSCPHCQLKMRIKNNPGTFRINCPGCKEAFNVTIK